MENNARIVLGVGYADYRKGIDLFVKTGINVIKANADAVFVWVGHWDEKMRLVIDRQLAETHLRNRFFFVGRKSDTDIYYAGADIYALTSREDPFPSVVMESLEVAVPVVGFKGAGGVDEFLEQGCGLLVAKEDISAMADAISILLAHEDKALALGKKGSRLVEESFSFRHYLFDLLDFVGLPLKRVSAIVPNYNYARYLDLRLGSIIRQTYPVFEIIVLDDASTDNSIGVIKSCLAGTTIDNRLIQNDQNTGSVFRQWQRGIEQARGDYIWICEADDYAAAEFIERSIDLFDDHQIVMTYTQSRQIDEQGHLLSDTYLDYTDDISKERWR
ncbi:MAG: glycosyltransferase, partial [Anaerolineae bacterium]|nr:glycosyltransferase [Anaerolineae bacterium]